MTKKDFELVAEVIGRTIKDERLTPQQADKLTDNFIERLSKENTMFNEQLFSRYVEQCTRLTDDLHYIFKGKVVAK